MEAGLIYEDGHFHTNSLRQIGDQVGVRHIAVETEDLAAHPSIDDGRCILVTAFQADGSFFVKPLLGFFLPGIISFSVTFENVSILTRIPAGAVCAILFNQIGTFAKPPVVFRVVATGLGDIVT